MAAKPPKIPGEPSRFKIRVLGVHIEAEGRDALLLVCLFGVGFFIGRVFAYW